MKKYICDINTIRWYCEYQRLILRIPTHGTASTKCWYEFCTENLKTIGQGKQRHFF